jgi:hypothetical protein
MKKVAHSSTSKASWLLKLIGNWTYEFRTADNSDHPGITAKGTETVRPVGDVWVLLESEGTFSDASRSHSVTALGFEPAIDRFTGSVVSTTVPTLFVYDGHLSDDGLSLILETEGPAMTEGREIDRYRDIIQFTDDNTRTTSAQVLVENNCEWREFMMTRYIRVN